MQEAFIAALRHWPVRGVPDDPSAWLLQVARRKALDALRRERTRDAHAPRHFAELDAATDAATEAAQADPPDEGDPFADDQLRMILLCCHPAVTAESRVALALKLVSGFSVGEIARAFLADERAVAQRLVRAKKALRDAGASFDMPKGHELTARLDAVHDVLYLMFNEGHTAHEGDALLRRDLCDQALRLVERLLGDARTVSPTGHALAALFCFHSSRFAARADASGAPVRLADQDRAQWDRARIARGFAHFERAAEGQRVTAYHIEAQIASLHAVAPAFALTDWVRIVRAYDQLIALAPSPVVALNRIVAVRQAAGAEQAFKELRALLRDERLSQYPLAHAVRADLLEELDRPEEARDAWKESRSLTPSRPLQLHAEQRLADLDALLLARDVDSGAPHPS